MIYFSFKIMMICLVIIAAFRTAIDNT